VIYYRGLPAAATGGWLCALVGRADQHGSSVSYSGWSEGPSFLLTRGVLPDGGRGAGRKRGCGRCESERRRHHSPCHGHDYRRVRCIDPKAHGGAYQGHWGGCGCSYECAYARG
jgi:hypothetical protein